MNLTQSVICLARSLRTAILLCGSNENIRFGENQRQLFFFLINETDLLRYSEVCKACSAQSKRGKTTKEKMNPTEHYLNSILDKALRSVCQDEIDLYKQNLKKIPSLFHIICADIHILLSSLYTYIMRIAYSNLP